MLAFWAVVAVIIIISLVFLIPPLIKKRSAGKTVARKDLTVTVYRDQFAELENDLKNGTISQEQYDSAKIDLEKNLLDDIGKAEKLDEQEKNAVSPIMGRIAAVLVVIAVPVGSISLYSNWGAGIDGIAPEEVPQAERIAQQKHNQEETIQNMVAQLENKLKDDPTDGEGWFMLARTYRFLKRYDDAVKAFEKSLPLGGSNSADVLFNYADAIAMAEGRQLTPKAVGALEQALKIDPNHNMSLWLLGTASYQNKDYPSALKHWEKLYSVLPPNSQDKQQIAANINEVRSLMGMSPMPMPEPVAVASEQQGQEVAMSDARVQGTVSLSGAVAGKVSPEDTVFVFARAASGPRMPVAIIRKQVKDMPFEFTLDDSLAMNPNLRISSVPKVIVGARVSKTGNAMPQPGDLQVLSKAINVASNEPLKLVINEVVQ
ncbi:MAG: c-type cytochrome biogenesis protein CcmI [Gammaproteobacteria bacterium]|nr:c-type cytochrome biogenesis protein CcmI [Gammaproteobacteria bacterium]